jgi:hypothetical protein
MDDFVRIREVYDVNGKIIAREKISFSRSNTISSTYSLPPSQSQSQSRTKQVLKFCGMVLGICLIFAGAMIKRL